MLSQLLLISLLPLTAFAHFSLVSPPGREGDEEAQGDFPCGGGKTVSPKRTKWSLTGGPIQLDLGHDESLVQVVLGLGNDPGTNFNITLLPTIQEQGPGDFCVGAVTIPEGVARDGVNATIQVITNGESTPGLYNCADITFSSSAPSGGECKNGTGIRTAAYSGPPNANGTGAEEGASTTGSATTGSSTAAAPSPTGAAGKVNMCAWSLLVGAAAVGAAALL